MVEYGGDIDIEDRTLIIDVLGEDIDLDLVRFYNDGWYRFEFKTTTDFYDDCLDFWLWESLDIASLDVETLDTKTRELHGWFFDLFERLRPDDRDLSETEMEWQEHHRISSIRDRENREEALDRPDWDQEVRRHRSYEIQWAIRYGRYREP